MNFFRYITKLDWWLIIAAIILVGFGLSAIFSVGLARGSMGNFEKQIAFLLVGLVIMVLMSLFDYRILKNNSYLILFLYFVCMILLAGLYFLAPQIKGAARWYKIGFLSLNPTEPAKFILIMLLAKYFSKRHTEMYSFRHIVFSGLYLLPLMLLVFIQPDLGSAIVLFLIWLGILFVSGIKIKHFLIIVLCCALIGGLAWNFLLHDYQKQRITSFLFPYDYYGAAWSQNQTRISIGSGQLMGQGLFEASQVKYGFLPEPHTDFIFSVLAHELGLVGVSILFLVYTLLIWRILKIGVESQSNFPRLFAYGFAIYLMIQFFMNIGMNAVILPVVGIALPFVSYGGGGLIFNFIGLGILQSIRIRKAILT